jgi:hypothetical protein
MGAPEQTGHIDRSQFTFSREFAQARHVKFGRRCRLSALRPVCVIQPPKA